MGTPGVTQQQSWGSREGLWLPQGYRGQRRVSERGVGTRLPVVQSLAAHSTSLRSSLQSPAPAQGAAWESTGALTCQGTWPQTHRPCPLSLAGPLTEVWLTVAENLPLARTMLHALMGRLQSRFTPRADATSKADIWRLAAVDPLMVSHGAGPPWGLGRSLPASHPSICRPCAPSTFLLRRWTRMTSSWTSSRTLSTPSCCSSAAARGRRPCRPS